jgi:hypothetical protein
MLSPAYVLQEGLEFVAENGELGIPPVYLVAQLELPNTTLATAWTLSGLSSTGDRYLVWAGYDLPYGGSGCPSSGYSLGYQIGSSSGAEGSPQCVAGIVPAEGDEIELSLDLACGGTVGDLCLNLTDQTLGHTSSPTVVQPTPTATYFQNAVASQPNGYGYFTGIDTVVADPVVSSGCLVISGLPTVSYYLQGFLPTGSGTMPFLATDLSEYELFANETEPTGAVCTSTVSPVETLGPTIGTMYYPGGSSSDGPHWLSMENWTSVAPAITYGRFQTDAVPVTASMTLNRTVADLGQLVNARVNASGGTGPYTCAWFVDGGPVAGTSCDANLSVTETGTVNISALAIDADGSNGLAWADLVAYTDPTLLAPLATPGAIDVGQSVEFVAQYSGGAGGLTFQWNDSLPPSACSSSSSAELTCTPPAAGTATIAVDVTDAVGQSARSPTLTFPIRPDPTAVLTLEPGAPALLDVGGSTGFELNVSGGAAPYHDSWSLPLGPCVISAASATCRPGTAGHDVARVTVNDSNGFSVTSAPVEVVVDPRPTVNVTASYPTVTVGENLTLASSVSGGQGPYAYTWGGLPPGCAAPSAPDLVCAPDSAGAYTITVNVTDAIGGNASGRVAITVDPSANTSSHSAFGGEATWAAIAVAAAIVVVAAVVIGRDRRARRPPTPPSGYVIVSGPTIRPPESG